MSVSAPIAIGSAVGEGAASLPGVAPIAVGLRFSLAKAAQLLELPDAAIRTALLALAQRQITVFTAVSQTWSFAPTSMRRLALHFAELVFFSARAASQPCPRWALDPLLFPVLVELLTELHHGGEAEVAS